MPDLSIVTPIGSLTLTEARVREELPHLSDLFLLPSRKHKVSDSVVTSEDRVKAVIMAHLTGSIKTTAATLNINATSISQWTSIAKLGLCKTGSRVEQKVRIETLLTENQELRAQNEALREEIASIKEIFRSF